MASSITVPQLLIPEGELNEILRIINKKPKSVKIVGQLFGLWRNSLIQPVVHFVAGPGEKSKMSQDQFISDSGYSGRLKSFANRAHGLLQIGIWLSGSARRYPTLDRSSPEFNLQTAGSMIDEKGKYVVFLFVDCTEGSVDMEYHIIDRQRLSSRVASLTAKDILPGPSCFRSLKQVFKEINFGAKFPSKHDQHIRYFSTDMLKANNQPLTSIDTQITRTTTPTNRAPACTITPNSPAPQLTWDVKPVRQWYESESGQSLLKEIVDRFQALGLAANISRDTNSHDLHLEIKSSISFHFPADFPEGGVSLSWVNDSSRFPRYSEGICQVILDRALKTLD